MLYEHPKVLEAAVVGQPDMTDGSGRSSRLIKAVVVLRRGEKATPEEFWPTSVSAWIATNCRR